MNEDDKPTANSPLTVQPSSLTWQHIYFYGGEKNELLFAIKPDGTIERGPMFTTEDAMSLQFWDLIAKAFPTWKASIKG